MLKSTVVLVTGACGLLGKRIVKDIVGQNGFVLITDKDITKAKKIFKNLPSELIFYANLDITDADSIDNAIEICKQKFGSLDACINAAYPKTKKWGRKFEDLEFKDLNENLKIHLGGAILLSQRLIKHFLLQGYGNFIHISSIHGVSAPKFEHYDGTLMSSPVEYSAVKSGIISITRWLAKYYKNNNIRVNCVSPGGILDNQPDSFIKKYKNSCTSKGLLESEDITGVIIFLLSNESKYINGQNIIVDDGWSL